MAEAGIGYHNANYEATKARIEKSKMYEDLSTVCIIPTPTGFFHEKFIQHFMSMMMPMNQKFYRIFKSKMEVGDAYSEAIEEILQNPELSKYKYVLFLEWDNLCYPNSLLLLYENMDKYDVISGLYFCKGENGAPMAYGKTDEYPINFRPWLPPENSIVPVRGVGMGFCLAKLSIFKNKKLPRPFFKTIQEYEYGKGGAQYTQDLKWCENLNQLGYKIAVDSRVRIGHFDFQTEFTW